MEGDFAGFAAESHFPQLTACAGLEWKCHGRDTILERVITYSRKELRISSGTHDVPALHQAPTRRKRSSLSADRGTPGHMVSFVPKIDIGLRSDWRAACSSWITKDSNFLIFRSTHACMSDYGDDGLDAVRLVRDLLVCEFTGDSGRRTLNQL